MSLFEERVARNEAVFRRVNEEVEGLDRRWREEPSEPLRLVCECGNADCSETVVVPFEVYEHVRANSRHFIVRPGHELPDVERVAVKTSAYVVAEKDTPTTIRIA